MSGVSLPVTRPVGRALVVAGSASRAEAISSLEELGFACTEVDDPYAAMAELCRRPMAYRALILSLAGVYREELTLISAVKRRFPSVEVWLAHTDGRQAALADSMRLGADGLLADDGLHRVALPGSSGAAVTAPETSPAAGVIGTVSALESQSADAVPVPTAPAAAVSVEGGRQHQSDSGEVPIGEPVLSADELRALLQEQPSSPPVNGEQ